MDPVDHPCSTHTLRYGDENVYEGVGRVEILMKEQIILPIICCTFHNCNWYKYIGVVFVI